MENNRSYIVEGKSADGLNNYFLKVFQSGNKLRHSRPD